MIHVVLTFDVEQWDPRSRAECYSALIDALGPTATTWFVAEDRTQSFAERYPELVERLLDRGHEIGAHVHFQSASFEEQVIDLQNATARLRSRGAPCVTFRGGAHVFTDQLAKVITDLGYSVDSSALPGLMRRYHTRAGDTFAAYPHVWSARPFWWRPGLLELPTASFPMTRPIDFMRKRFRLPLLLFQPASFRRRVDELAAVYPAPDVPVVVLGHSSDVEREGQVDAECLAKLSRSLEELRTDPKIKTSTMAGLGAQITSGAVDVGLRFTPPAWMTAAALQLTAGVTQVAQHPLFARALRGLFPRG